jgi:DNA-binding response OmpR family regulator
MLDRTRCARVSTKYPNLLGKRILVVEDDAVIAVDYDFQLRAVGAKPQAYKSTNESALNYLITHEVDAVIVDYQLRDGTCEPVLKFLGNSGIPCVVVSACTFEMRGSLGSHHILSKPATPSDIWSALSDMLH